MLVEMPKLVDRSQRFAEGILRNGGFRFSVEYEPSTEAQGAVIAQLYKGRKIAEGTKLPIGSKVKLIVGRNEMGVALEMPNLYGLTIVQARERVKNMMNMGFFVGSCDGCITPADSSVARVFTQSPAYEEGGIVASGGIITVSATKDFVESEEIQVPE